jgi:signal transduction histidine kinase
MKRLHLKLYLAVVGTLVVFMIAAAIIWHYFGPRRAIWGVEGTAGVAAMLFENQPPTQAQEDAMVKALAWQLNAEVATCGSRTSGAIALCAVRQEAREGWQVTRQGPVFRRALDDGRWLIIRPRHRLLLHGMHMGLLLLSIAVALALIIYPITRGITARLARLKASVRELGEGNLAARVAVEGKDEVAALARGFNESAERVENLVRAHKLLLANCSHELRTPLARVRMAVEKLAAPESPARIETTRSIAELDALIGEMLLASRLDALRKPERQEDIDLLALLAEEAAYSGLDAQGEPLHVIGDPHLLRRMVRNLLDNAQRHAGGATRVEVRRAPDGMAALLIEDQGPGVPPSERDKIFEPFYRVAEPAGETRGAGLGLSIVRQVARAHGGEASCEPADGQGLKQGTRFVVLLPEAAPAAPG